MKRSVERRLNEAIVRRKHRRDELASAVDKLSPTCGEQKRHAAIQILLFAHDVATAQNEVADAGPQISPSVWNHFERVAGLANELADLIASHPGFEERVLTAQLEGESPSSIARRLADAAARANLEVARGGVPARAEVKRAVARAAIEAYILLVGKMPSAANNPITNKRQSKFISFLNDVISILRIPLRGDAGSLAQEEIKAFKNRQKSED